ncbi:MAG: methylenetetrahydrofolate reductase [Solirubrobacterales bacterium]
MDLRCRITSLQGEFLLFAVTPPRISTTAEEAQAIAETTVARLEPLGLDGLILYDIDDEVDRNPEERPFPFLPTMDPADYLERHLKAWRKPVVVYRATAKYTEEELRQWIGRQDTASRMAVLVGAPSRERRVATTLRRAQQLRAEVAPGLLLGAVAIPERHTRKDDEHLGLVAKQEAGCSYFVTQVVYDVNATKNLVSDYAYECRDRDLEPVPIVFTFSVCGSMRTLRFLRWLGVDVPRWIENDLRHADDTLDASIKHAEHTALELISFCRHLGVPFGINVESVSIRKVEIEASVQLVERLGREMRRSDASGAGSLVSD